MAPSDKTAPHFNAANNRLATLTNAVQLASSFVVITAWCGRVPDWDDPLETLWQASGNNDWKPNAGGAGSPATPGVGSATLARLLKQQNHGRYTGTIDQNLILRVTPSTVAGIADELTW
jgi:hypothetical protein